MSPHLGNNGPIMEMYLSDPATLIRWARIKYDDEDNQLIEQYDTGYRVAYYNKKENKTYWWDNNVEFCNGNGICRAFELWDKNGRGPALGNY